ncbi:hypothetical protein H6A24_06345 [Bacteroides caecicola]|uniref:NVEALA protein n=1 Tax=Bacteroides caecicola TaxID=1462569 RepID=A0ABS2F7T7_9BACE|nr:NVEALA domain-containing protein [Bacteroides caecicola]MBM6806121.1 hypothetical protein [Bacteroides caecicola]MBU3809228.1 NVEALA domain-containing protein [Candidatus Phocaeicola faecipullorum]
MKNAIKIMAVTAIITVAGIGAYTVQRENTMSDIALANVEALAQGEQADVSDCIPASSQCWALHPTDPSKDKIRYNARW